MPDEYLVDLREYTERGTCGSLASLYVKELTASVKASAVGDTASLPERPRETDERCQMPTGPCRSLVTV
jgi:hypothetical protein